MTTRGWKCLACHALNALGSAACENCGAVNPMTRATGFAPALARFEPPPEISDAQREENVRRARAMVRELSTRLVREVEADTITAEEMLKEFAQSTDPQHVCGSECVPENTRWREEMERLVSRQARRVGRRPA